MRWRIAICTVLTVAGLTKPCFSVDPRYPDWPCTQAKVPEISLAAVWAGPPLDDVATKWKDDPKVTALLPRLAARRTPLDDAQKTITEFLAGSTAQKTETGKLLFAGLFDTLNAQRSQVLNGLERVTRKQREAADKIRDVAPAQASELLMEAAISHPVPRQGLRPALAAVELDPEALMPRLVAGSLKLFLGERDAPSTGEIEAGQMNA